MPNRDHDDPEEARPEPIHASGVRPGLGDRGRICGRTEASFRRPAIRPNGVRFGGLRGRLIACFILSFAPVFFVASVIQMSQSAKLLTDGAEEKLQIDSMSVGTQAEHWDGSLLLMLESLRSEPEIESMVPGAQVPQLSRTKNIYSRFEIIRITKPDGYSVARTDGRTPVYYGDRGWFQSCMKGAPFVRQALVTRTSNKAAINYSTPIVGRGGKIVGVLSAVMG